MDSNEKHITGMTPDHRRKLKEANRSNFLKRKVEALETELELDRVSAMELSPQQSRFCDLFVNGGAEYAGRHGKCYQVAFDCETDVAANAGGKRLLSKSYIADRIRLLIGRQEDEVLAAKLRITETLYSIMDEASKDVYSDRFGSDISPAPLRAVAVNAAKALWDMYNGPKAVESRLTIEGNTGVVFNVVVPAPILPAKESD